MSLSDTALTDFWREVFAAADRALELEGAERDAFIKRYSDEHPVVGAELKALMDAADLTSTLEMPASVFAAPFLHDASDADETSTDISDIDGEMPPFGPYRVRRELGAGGMGAVYLAERADDQYRKEVALKVLPRWGGHDRRRLQRFVEERQILATLDHSGIARLLDGGVTADGLPWFAMEYVDGVPIDRYCDDRSLTVEDRLELFCQVCSAVQYAHGNLVVHRDLKPANILVTREGRVRLLDFGIAKLLGTGAMVAELTIPGERLLTPMYASPEQIRGETTSISSDVYALGVLLNVLLTGRYPYSLPSWEHHDVARAVLEQEPERPSLALTRPTSGTTGPAHSPTPEIVAARRGTSLPLLRRRLQGDLDAIVLKAVDKEAGRRYATVEQLQLDVRRYLTGLPVLARPDSRLYSARKFVRRHRAGVTVATALAALVLAFGVVATVQAARIRSQAQRITLERDRAQEVSGYLDTVFQMATAGRLHGVATSREILDSAASRIDEHHFVDPEQRALLMFEIARTYHELNFDEKARSLAEQAVDIRRALRPQNNRAVAESLQLLGSVQLAQGELGRAEKSFAEALALRRGAPERNDREIARTLVGLASVLRAERKLEDAERFSREAVAIDRARGGDTRADRAQSTSALAGVLLDRGEHREATELFRKALALARETHAEEDIAVAAAVFDLGSALKIAGEHGAADSLIRYGMGLYERLLSAATFRGITNGGKLPDGSLTGATAAVQRALGHPTTTTPGSPAVDAVGESRIAFTSDRHGPDAAGDLGNQEIYAMNVDGSDQRRLTRSAALDNSPAWSPDGKRIAFTSRREGGLQIILINSDGSGEHRLTSLSETGEPEPTWSPDGQRIAFRSRSRGEIYAINVDGSGLTNLTNHPANDASPAWSPDGKRIAFVSDRAGNPEIYVMGSDGRNPIRLTHNAARDDRPSWSPDARRIAFQSDRDGDQEIYVMNADGSSPQRLTSNPGEDGNPSWSPTGRQIVFHRRVLGHLQIHLMNADGRNVRRLTDLSPLTFNGFPSWSPRLRGVSGLR